MDLRNRSVAKIMSKMNRFAKKPFNRYFSLLRIFIFSILFILFQNCSKGFNVFDQNTVSEKNSVSGNGGGYEGKLSFYRFIPDILCDSQETYKEMILFDGDQVWLYENSAVEDGKCVQNRTEISASDIGRSPFQNMFIDTRDYLFASYDLSHAQMPELIAESLCRDNWVEPNFEIVNHYNYKTGTATTQLYYRSIENGEIQSEKDELTSRLLTQNEVEYQSFNQNLNFKIDFQSVTGQYNRKFQGEITKVGENYTGTVNSTSIECITGGGLDSSIWPLKRLPVSSTISNFLVIPGRNDINYQDRNPVSVNWFRPFILQEEIRNISINDDIFHKQMAVSSNVPIKNSKWMTFSGVETNGTPYFGRNYYIYRSDDPTTLRTLFKGQSLSSFIPSEYLINSEINQLSEDEFSYWVTHVTSEYSNGPKYIENFYRVYNWKTNVNADYLFSSQGTKNIVKLSSLDGSWSTGMVGSFGVGNGGRLEFNYMNTSERLEKKIVLPEVANCSPIQSLGEVENYPILSTNNQILVIVLSCSDLASNSYTRKVMQISLQDSRVSMTEENESIFWVSPDGEHYVVAEPTANGAGYIPQSLKLVETKSGLRQSTQIDPHLRSSADANQYDLVNNVTYVNQSAINLFKKDATEYIVGFSTGYEWNVRLKNLKTGQESTVCNNKKGISISNFNLSESSVAFVTFEAGESVKMYEVSESTQCKLLNSAPVKYSNLRGVVPTQSGVGIVTSEKLGSISFSESGLPDDIYFLNKDGRVPLHINLNNPKFRFVRSFQASSDQSKLYLLGTSSSSTIYQDLFSLRLK